MIRSLYNEERETRTATDISKKLTGKQDGFLLNFNVPVLARGGILSRIL